MTGDEESHRSNPGAARNSAAERNKVQTPDFSMRTKEMSYFDLSTASNTFRAEQMDTSCSVDLPPQMIASRILDFFMLTALLPAGRARWQAYASRVYFVFGV
jgi:hypothetical protein